MSAGRSRAGGRRRLSESERALWDEVTRSVAPIARPGRDAAAVGDPRGGATSPDAPVDGASSGATDRTGKTSGAAGAGVGGPTPAARARAAVRAAAAERERQPQPPDIDKRTRRRLARGTERVEARLDLHGLFQEEAHRRLRVFLASAQAEGRGLVLVITGKGRAANDLGDRGVLRRAVPEWLRQPALRRYVSEFGPANQTHGGEGAFYVRLRRRARDRS